MHKSKPNQEFAHLCNTISFPVSFTIEYKVGIAEFYLCMAFGSDLLKIVVTTG